MKNEIFKYLKENISSDPQVVDSLIVSAFLIKNGLKKPKNNLIKKHYITQQSEEYKSLEDFLSYIDASKIDFNLETVIELFEFVISPADRVVSGAVYTPKYIREFIVDESIKLAKQRNLKYKICDPACGCGGFLYTATKKIRKLTKRSYSKIFKENIFGLGSARKLLSQISGRLSIFRVWVNLD